MTVIFAVQGQELLAAEQSVIATDGNGWQLHNLGPSLAQGASSPGQGPRFPRLPPPPAQGPVCYWPQMEASKCRRLPEPRLATALTQQILGLLAESKILNSGVPKALPLSAQSRFICFSMACVHWLCLSGHSTEEATAVLQHPGPERKPQPPCAAEAPCATAKTTPDLAARGTACDVQTPAARVSLSASLSINESTPTDCWKHQVAAAELAAQMWTLASR